MYKDDLYQIYRHYYDISEETKFNALSELSICIASIYFVKYHKVYKPIRHPSLMRTSSDFPLRLLQGEYNKKEMENYLNTYQECQYPIDVLINYINTNSVYLGDLSIQNQRVLGKKLKYWNITHNYDTILFEIERSGQAQQVVRTDSYIESSVLERYILHYVNTLHLRFPDIADYLRNKDIPEPWISRMIYAISLKTAVPVDSLSLAKLSVTDFASEAIGAALYRVPVAGYTAGALVGGKVKSGEVINYVHKISDESRILDESGEVTRYLNNNVGGTPESKQSIVDEELESIGSAYKIFFGKNAMVFLILWLNTNFNPFQSNDIAEDGYTETDYRSELEALFRVYNVTDFDKTVNDIISLLPSTVTVTDDNKLRLAFNYSSIYFNN